MRGSPSNPTVQIRRAMLDEIIALRHAELRPGRPRAAADFDGDRDPTTAHFGAFSEPAGDPVGCLSVMRQPWGNREAWQFRGMATRGDLVRHGVGARLLGFAVATMRADAPLLCWCKARVGAAPFWARQGWVTTSDPYDLPGIGPHVTLVLR